jgi:hypothetical protein
MQKKLVDGKCVQKVNPAPLFILLLGGRTDNGKGGRRVGGLEITGKPSGRLSDDLD